MNLPTLAARHQAPDHLPGNLTTQTSKGGAGVNLSGQVEGSYSLADRRRYNELSGRLRMFEAGTPVHTAAQHQIELLKNRHGGHIPN